MVKVGWVRWSPEMAISVGLGASRALAIENTGDEIPEEKVSIVSCLFLQEVLSRGGACFLVVGVDRC